MGVITIALGQPGFWQIVIVLAIFLLFFGSNRLPKMARSLGESLTEFKKGLRGEGDDEEEKKKVGSGEGDEAAKPGSEAESKEGAKEDAK
jgi:sec-independent protein translocase protein TatA